MPVHYTKYQNIDSQDIFCPFCAVESVDESHFLLHCPFFGTERTALVNENVCLDDGIYDSIENLRKCTSFMDFIMRECKDILTTL